MKSIANMLSRGNLTPREKFLLLIHNDIQRMKIGKEALTPADKMALESWSAKTNEEAREWNQLNEGWKFSGRMDLEVEIFFKDAQVAYLSETPIALSLLLYPAYRRMGFAIEGLERIKKVTIDEAIKITQKQKEIKLKEGLDFDYAVYRMAFELLTPEDRKRMNELYEEVEYEHQYLDQEEIIAKLYGGKKELSYEAKDTLAELVAEQSYNKFAKESQLFHYFACIPLMEISRRFLKNHGIEIPKNPAENQDDEDDDILERVDAVRDAMQAYADEHGTTIKAMLRDECRRWLDQGLLDEYTPLIVSDDADLLARWFHTKAKARKKIFEHVTAGKLALRNRNDTETRKEKMWSKNLYDREFAAAQMILEAFNLEPTVKGELEEKKAFEEFSDKVITGESIYAFDGNYEFVTDFKKRADTYDANLGLVYAENDPEQKGDHLDQELLVCDVGPDGKPMAFSAYRLNTMVLSGLFKGMSLIEEYAKDGKTWIGFKDAKMAQAFLDRRQDLVDGYATLLAFETLFKKLSPIYEADMTDHVTGRLTAVRGFIEEHNKAIHTAANPEDETKNRFLKLKEPLQFDENWTIDIDAIKPDRKIIAEHEAKLKEIFPEM